MGDFAYGNQGPRQVLELKGGGRFSGGESDRGRSIPFC